MKTIEPIRLNKTDYSVDGLFVKGISRIQPTCLKTPILMVHGACLGWWAYHKWLPFYAAAGWRVYSMSLRNHTGSYSVPEEKYLKLAVDDYAEDVLKVLTWIDQPAILIGRSMGAITVQKAAEQANLRALILLASVGPGQLGAIRDPLTPDKAFMFSPEQARKIWFHKIDDQSFNEIYKQLVPESVSVINQYRAGEVRVNRLKIRSPVFVIGAEHDGTIVHNFQ